MLRKTFLFTLPGKVALWQKCQNDVLCGNMNMDVSNSSSKILVLQYCLDSCWSIVAKKWNDIPSQTGLSNYYS